MNPISWLVYIADAAGAANTVFLWLGVIATALTLIGLAGYTIRHFSTDEAELTPEQDAWRKAKALHDESPHRYNHPGKYPASPNQPKAEPYTPLKAIRAPLTAAIIFFALLIAVPSKETMYVIAAVETAEMVLESEALGRLGESGERALDALDSASGWIERNLDEPAQAAREARRAAE